jgi:hypothetical protein
MHADEPLPLDDPRWRVLADAAARLSPHLGGQSVAEHDLSIALATNNLRCLNRYHAPGGVWVRARVSFLCWAGYRLQSRLNGLSIARRRDWPREGYSLKDLKHRGDPRERGTPFFQIELGQGVLLGWQPDLEQLWPAVFPPTRVVTSSSPGKASTAHKRKRKRKRGASQVDLAGELLAIVFPQDRWRDMTPTAVRHDCGGDPRAKAKLREEEKPLPSRRSFGRFMRRARTRGR